MSTPRHHAGEYPCRKRVWKNVRDGLCGRHSYRYGPGWWKVDIDGFVHHHYHRRPEAALQAAMVAWHRNTMSDAVNPGMIGVVRSAEPADLGDRSQQINPAGWLDA